ncbi:MAG TPA: TadE/TadG family type IV pilus assembly protein [Candidatus Dormibacteraeota bacterium]
MGPLCTQSASPARRARRRGERGQALIETAIVVVFALTLFVGVYAVGVAISDSNMAGQATRTGARFAAQVGNNNYQLGTTDACQVIAPPAKDPCGVDKQVVANVAATILDNSNNTLLNYGTIRRVIIYQPKDTAVCVSGTTGSPYQNGDRGEIYTYAGSGTWSPATAPGGLYSLDLRTQTHPTEGAIGVQLDFDYQSPTPLISVNLSHTEYTVNCLAPSSH